LERGVVVVFSTVTIRLAIRELSYSLKKIEKRKKKGRDRERWINKGHFWPTQTCIHDDDDRNNKRERKKKRVSVQKKIQLANQYK
jgi:hypothetical protein